MKKSKIKRSLHICTNNLISLKTFIKKMENLPTNSSLYIKQSSPHLPPQAEEWKHDPNVEKNRTLWLNFAAMPGWVVRWSFRRFFRLAPRLVCSLTLSLFAKLLGKLKFLVVLFVWYLVFIAMRSEFIQFPVLFMFVS